MLSTENRHLFTFILNSMAPSPNQLQRQLHLYDKSGANEDPPWTPGSEPQLQLYSSSSNLPMYNTPPRTLQLQPSASSGLIGGRLAQQQHSLSMSRSTPPRSSSLGPGVSVTGGMAPHLLQMRSMCTPPTSGVASPAQ